MKFALQITKIIKLCVLIGVIVVVSVFACLAVGVKVAFAMPYYDLKPEPMVLRASFSTNYVLSSAERKFNICLASKTLNNTFVDVDGEFSFNLTVGERTEKRGYKNAKVIVGGEFVDGVGGGVCQVSTTLYNAVLLAGLEIVEYHPHSLPVNYVEPSFDAMVNSGWADLRFRNNTDNPIIIKSFADEKRILVEIYGQKLKEKFIRKSVITSEIEPPADKIILDIDGNYPNLKKGEFKKIKYGKKGYLSEGYLIIVEGNTQRRKKIRTDKYGASQGVIIQGTAESEEENLQENSFNKQSFLEKLLNHKKNFDKSDFL